MKKIGILTLVFQNYGTRLQSYALCKAIEKICPKSISFEVIDMEGIWETKFIDRKKLFIKSIFRYRFQSIIYIFNLIRWKIQNRNLNKNDNSEMKKNIPVRSFATEFSTATMKFLLVAIRYGMASRFAVRTSTCSIALKRKATPMQPVLA